MAEPDRSRAEAEAEAAHAGPNVNFPIHIRPDSAMRD